MTRRSCLHQLAGLFVAFLLIAAPQPALATIVFDDHFTGDSGGIPTNWYRIWGTGTVIEAGTTVTLGQDGVGDDASIGSDATIDPSSGTVRIETDFVGIVSQAGSGLFVPPAGFPVTCFICDIRLEDGRIEVGGITDEGDEWYDVGHLVGYAGGPIQLTFILGPTWFSVSTDSPPFASGPIDYSTVFEHLTREDLGTAASVVLFDYGDPGCTIIDRVVVDVEAASPVENMSIGTLSMDVSASPNPFDETTSIRFAFPTPGAMRVGIFDMAGREVRSIVVDGTERGSASLTWDGRDHAGMLVSAGVYWVRASQGDREAAARVLVLR
jgi:hypothetical protein